jgi:hypothetical protein
MSWARLDDNMLDHPKWRQALRKGGDGVLTIWFRLTSWCSRNLTDGIVPPEEVDDVAQIGRSKTRKKALDALVEAKLVAWSAPGECSLGVRLGLDEHTPRARQAHDSLTIVSYLQRNPTKVEVLAERGRRAQGQQNRRRTDRVTGHASANDVEPCPDRALVPIPSQSHPIPIPEEREERAREPEPPSVPGLDRVAAPEPGMLKPSRRELGEEPTGARPVMLFEFPPDWRPKKSHKARADELGLTDAEVFTEAEDCRNKTYDKPFRDPDKQFMRELGWLARDKETEAFKRNALANRRDNEMPGHDRSA